MTYSIKEVFYTLQGEGYHAGTPALFIRFSGCNLWSGRQGHRERDAVRNDAECPRWCDTDFADGERMTVDALLGVAMGEAPEDVPLIVLTGGEPYLQIDEPLLDALRTAFDNAIIAVETNGTVEPKAEVDWICVSPKVPIDRLKIREGDELKVVFPGYDPTYYAELAGLGFDHHFVSPEASTHAVGDSLISADNTARTIAFVQANPTWRLSLQSHKILGVR